MPVYAYKGVTTSGSSTRGFVDADSPRSARVKLRHDGVFPTELAERGVGEATPSAARRRFALPSLQLISSFDLALATRQLSTLVGAGIPLLEAMSALAEQLENPRLKSVIARARDRVNEGASLADALAQAGPFSDLYVGMVRAGEASGALEQVLARLADYLESQVRLKNKVASILIYPIVMMLFAGFVVAALVTVVLPQITELLISLNQPLPFYTRWIIAISEFAARWWWAVGASLLLGFLALRGAVRTEPGRAIYDRVRLRAPVLGRVLRVLSIARFTRTLSTLLAGGIPIVRALEVSRHVANNVVLGAAIDAARISISEGATIAQPLRASGEFPPLVTHLVEVGERSGELEAMLEKVADIYEEQVETSVTRLTALLEPLLILIMVGIVVMIILATLVPLLQITSAI